MELTLIALYRPNSLSEVARDVFPSAEDLKSCFALPVRHRSQCADFIRFVMKLEEISKAPGLPSSTLCSSWRSRWRTLAFPKHFGFGN